MYLRADSHSGTGRKPSPTSEPLAQVREFNTTIAAMLRDGEKSQVPATARSAIRVLRQALDPHRADEINTQLDTADRIVGEGRLSEASQAYQHAVWLSRKVRGAGELRTLLMSLGWVTLWIESGRIADAEQFLLEVTSGLIKRCGTEHPITRLAQLCFASMR